MGEVSRPRFDKKTKTVHIWACGAIHKFRLRKDPKTGKLKPFPAGSVRNTQVYDRSETRLTTSVRNEVYHLAAQVLFSEERKRMKKELEKARKSTLQPVLFKI